MMDATATTDYNNPILYKVIKLDNAPRCAIVKIQ